MQTQYTALEHFLVQTAILKDLRGYLMSDINSAVLKSVYARGEVVVR